jgi:hypothetical protein
MLVALPKKRDHLSSPEQANYESDERLGGSYSPKVLCAQAMGREYHSYSPKVLCAQAMGREYLCAACCLLRPKDDQTGPYIGVVG